MREVLKDISQHLRQYGRIDTDYLSGGHLHECINILNANGWIIDKIYNLKEEKLWIVRQLTYVLIHADNNFKKERK